jgi:hypothetical protein
LTGLFGGFGQLDDSPFFCLRNGVAAIESFDRVVIEYRFQLSHYRITMSKQPLLNDTKPVPKTTEQLPPRVDHSKAKPVQFEDELPGEFGHQILDI